MIGQWRWALLEDDELTSTEQHVALVLAVRMNVDGTIPSQYAPGSRRIATDAGRNKGTVQDALRSLVGAGWLEQVAEASGPRPAQYRATFPSGCSRNPASGYSGIPTGNGLVGTAQELVGIPQHDSGSSSDPTTSTPAHTSTSARYSEPGQPNTAPESDEEHEKAAQAAARARELVVQSGIRIGGPS